VVERARERANTFPSVTIAAEAFPTQDLTRIVRGRQEDRGKPASEEKKNTGSAFRYF